LFLGALFLRCKASGAWSWLPPSSVMVEDVLGCTSTPPIIFSMCLLFAEVFYKSFIVFCGRPQIMPVYGNPLIMCDISYYPVPFLLQWCIKTAVLGWRWNSLRWKGWVIGLQIKGGHPWHISLHQSSERGTPFLSDCDQAHNTLDKLVDEQIITKTHPDSQQIPEVVPVATHAYLVPP
jgi:hypothetical protein